jgi:tetratricopeptide (TPR) repeat protein
MNRINIKDQGSNPGHQIMKARRIVIFSLSVCMVIAWLAVSESLAAQKDNSVCPDMSEHQKVLDQGENYHVEHRSGTGPNDSLDLLVPERGEFPVTPKAKPYKDAAPTPSPHRGNIDLHRTGGAVVLPEEDSVSDSEPRRYYFGFAKELSELLRESINVLPLNTASQIDSAKITARKFEAEARYELAKKLYQRILAAQSVHLKQNHIARVASNSDLERVESCLSAISYADHNLSKKAASTYDQILSRVAAQKDLNLTDKVAILGPIVSRIVLLKEKNPLDAKDVYLKAQNLCNGYKRTLACLEMADKLNATAWTLEKDQSYTMAEKLYKEALAIKQKNLDPNDPETLAQYGELARLYGDEGKYALAKDTYERMLTAYRKLPEPGDTYASTLESYGDMLNGAHETGAADRIYAEARAYYSKHDRPTND